MIASRSRWGRIVKVPTSGADLNVVDTGGDGPALVLLHAFPFSSRMWAPQMEALSRTARVVAVDLKGFGGSDAPQEVSAYSMEAYADELRQVIAQLRLAAPVVLGLAFGGWVALSLYRKRPDLIGGMVLADSRPDAESEEGRSKREEQQSLARARGVRAVAGRWHELLTSGPSRERNPRLGAAVLEAIESGVQGFVGGLEAMKNRPDMTDVVRSIKVPTLIVAGEDDQICPPECSRQMHELIPNSQFAILPKVGALTNLEAPVAFNRLVIGFLGNVDKDRH